MSMVGGTSLRALRVKRAGWGCGKQIYACPRKDVFPSIPPHIVCTLDTVLVPLFLTAMGGFGDSSRALLQGLVDNSHISDLCLDLSSCEVRDQHPWVSSVHPGGPIVAGSSVPV